MKAGGLSKRRATLAAFAGLALAGTLAAAPAARADFIVNSTADRPDATSDATCAAANGKCTLRAAIDEANQVPGSDTIALPAGTFELTRPKPPPNIANSNAAGDLVLMAPVTIDGAGARKTIIKQTVRDRVLSSVVDNLAGGHLNDLTVTGGRVREDGNQFGGGIFNEGVLTLDEVVVRGNSVIPKPAANSFGGGILQDDGILTITDSSIRRNLVEVDSQNGGAIGGGISTLAGFLAIENSRVARNVARQIGSPGRSTGGGIAMRGATQILDSTIAANRGDEGSGLIVTSGADPGDLTLDSSTVVGNEGKLGGGVLLDAGEQHEILNSTISGNTARSGSALYANQGDTDLTHTTIAGNRAREGQAAVEAGALTTLDFYGSIVAGRGSDCGGTLSAFETDDQNVFGDSTCPPGISDVTGSPLLRPLDDNGGPTKTHAIRAASPAVDHVTVGPSLPDDQRGLPREFQASDAGSFERQ